FLTEHLDVSKLEHIGLIDVHTGLGAPGVDTLIFIESEDAKLARGVFPDINIVDSKNATDDTSKGYDGAGGFLCHGISWFLPSHVKAMCLAQEFGTVPTFAVFRSLIMENAMFHSAPTRRLPYAEKLRDVFYLHKSVQWKADIIQRGVRVFNQLKAFCTSG
ncbi:hypothetical protein PybrP1_001168, partial [[Pythium] brassicae (nom. inval.)]